MLFLGGLGFCTRCCTRRLAFHVEIQRVTGQPFQLCLTTAISRYRLLALAGIVFRALEGAASLFLCLHPACSLCGGTGISLSQDRDARPALGSSILRGGGRGPPPALWLSPARPPCWGLHVTMQSHRDYRDSVQAGWPADLLETRRGMTLCQPFRVGSPSFGAFPPFCLPRRSPNCMESHASSCKSLGMGVHALGGTAAVGACAAQGGPLGGPKVALAFRASVGCCALARRPPRSAGHLACGRGESHPHSSEWVFALSSAALLRVQSIFSPRSK